MRTHRKGIYGADHSSRKSKHGRDKERDKRTPELAFVLAHKHDPQR